MLLHSKGDWDVQLGPLDHPDVVIAKQIASAFGVHHRHLFIDPLKDSELESKLKDYCAEGLTLRQASMITQVQYYPMLYAEGTIVIDGSLRRGCSPAHV